MKEVEEVTPSCETFFDLIFSFSSTLELIKLSISLSASLSIHSLASQRILNDEKDLVNLQRVN